MSRTKKNAGHTAVDDAVAVAPNAHHEACPPKKDIAPNASLFRPESLVHRPVDFLGPVILARPWSSWILLAITTAILASGIAFATLNSYTKRTTVGGLLIPERGVVRVHSAFSGVAQQLSVREGQKVELGDVLMVIAEDKQIAASMDIPRQLAHFQNNLMHKRRESLKRTIDAIRLTSSENERTINLRIKQIKEQQARNKEEIDFLGRRERSALALMERFRLLNEAKAASSIDLYEREEQANTIKGQIISAKRQKTDLAMLIVSAQGELNQNRARTETQLSDFERELATLNQQTAELHSREALAITAPVAGTIAAINIQPGQLTGTAPLLIILPKGAPLIAQIYAPSRAIGFIEPNQEVRLRFHAFPYQRYGQHQGIVTEVARSPLSPTEISEKLSSLSSVTSNRLGSTMDAEGLYRVSIQLNDQSFTINNRPIQLLPGMTFDADILQEKRRIVDWLLDPLRGITGRIG